MIEPTWAKRNVLLDQFELADCSVVDFDAVIEVY